MTQGRAPTDDERRRERRRLAEIALRLVETEGRDAASLRRVAAEAGVSRSTPYGWFDHKEALLDAARVVALDGLGDACHAALADAEGPAARLAAVARAYVAYAIARPAAYDLIFEPCVPSADHDASAARYRTLAVGPLADAAAQGRIAVDPEALAQVLWATTHGLVSLRRAGKLRHGYGFDALFQLAGDVLAFGYVPREAP